MKTIIFGASGMVGMGVLLECLDDSRINSVLVVGRSSCGVTHPKLTEVIHKDFYNFTSIQNHFTDCDACFFCLGTSAAGKTESEYHHQTYDLTIAAAQSLFAANPNMTFCYVSGEGTDSTEKGRIMWARVKGKTENALLRLFDKAYMFRPGFIQPMRGEKSKTYGWLYVVLRPVAPLFRLLFPKMSTTTINVARAMLRVSLHGDSQKLLNTVEINRVAAI